MKPYFPPGDKRACMARIGHMSQLAGVRRSFICEGRARDVEALDFDNGTGLRFTVLPGRCMDISAANYKCVPLCFVAKPGLAQGAEYEPQGMGWLHGFFAGLLTTCGLSNVGDPCDDVDPELGIVHHGLHGRISKTGADNVGYASAWNEDGRFVLNATGRMREAVLHSENLTLTRNISTEMGSNTIIIVDAVENECFSALPLTILYHINPGYPILSEHSRIILPTAGVTPGTDAAVRSPNSYNDFHAPVRDKEQFVYVHDMRADGEGMSCAALVNEALELGLYVRYDTRNLPVFAQWKCLGEGDYVVGLEPANSMSVSRVKMREMGRLQMIEPGEIKKFRVEIGVLDGLDAIRAFEKTVEGIKHA